MHPHQLTVPVELVRGLVAEQFPEWACLPIERVASSGTVNALFRIGDGLAARFPLQPADPVEARRALEVEAAAARQLLGRVPFPTPEPVAPGRPGAGYPREGHPLTS
jgi:aminoglycoside phosphotransferase (APT) family kinase protein